MAWQLIYTSAPRLLEAGRSGFGTVARHRAISALLASAIERSSQFSRLPGADAGRVIYGYRVIAVAGGRFHVLSAIRDAGADYTGRTNHIAHHLIADAREVAQVSQPNGPSPADVLMGMEWATSWSSPPRYLEADEEIALSNFRPRIGGAAWSRVTGNPDSAWLLASREASRGAYVIQPAGLDLREVFGESLRLMPERLWQISFTTSLQPSDEPADFRWIGVEERSPLRAQVESSGRPILNLAAPSTLPQPELAPAASVAPSLPSVAASVATMPAATPAALVEPMPQIAGSPATGPGRVTSADRETKPRPAHRDKGPKQAWLLGAGALAAIVIAVVGYSVGAPMYASYQRKNAARRQIDVVLNGTGFFSPKVHSELKAADDLNAAKELAEAADRSLAMARVADFPAMARLPDQAARDHAASVHLNVPEEIAGLDERLVRVAAAYQKLKDFEPKSGDGKALDQVGAMRRDAIQLATLSDGGGAFEAIKQKINDLADKRELQALRMLLDGSNLGRSQPAMNLAAFKRAVGEIHPASGDEQTIANLKTVRQTIDDWEAVESAQSPGAIADLESRLKKQPAWPAWLALEVSRRIDTAKANSMAAPAERDVSGVSNHLRSVSSGSENSGSYSQAPIYFVSGIDGVANLVIKEIALGLKYSVRPANSDSEVELRDLIGDGTLRRSVAGKPDFVANRSRSVIEPASGASTIAIPFRLLAQDAKGAPVFQIWICSAGGNALFGARRDGVTRNGDTLELNPAMLGISGTPKNPIYIRLPATCFATTRPALLQPLTGWSIDLSAERKQIEVQLSGLKQALAAEEKKAAEPQKDQKANFADLAAGLEEEARFDEQEKGKLADAKDSLLHRCGGYLQAVSLQLKAGGDPIFNAGAALKALTAADDAKTQELTLRAAINAVLRAIDNLRTTEQKSAEPKLRRLRTMLGVAEGDTAEAKVDRAREAEASKKRIEDLRAKMASVPALMNEQVPPPGIYEIFARDAGSDIPLVQIQISETSK